MTATQQSWQEGIKQRKLHIASNMLSRLHIDMKTVSEATELSEQELMKLQKEGREKS